MKCKLGKCEYFKHPYTNDYIDYVGVCSISNQFVYKDKTQCYIENKINNLKKEQSYWEQELDRISGS